VVEFLPPTRPDGGDCRCVCGFNFPMWPPVSSQDPGLSAGERSGSAARDDRIPREPRDMPSATFLEPSTSTTVGKPSRRRVFAKDRPFGGVLHRWRGLSLRLIWPENCNAAGYGQVSESGRFIIQCTTRAIACWLKEIRSKKVHPYRQKTLGPSCLNPNESIDGTRKIAANQSF